MPTIQKSLSSRQSIRAALSTDETYATPLLAILVDAYGTEAFQWDPITIVLELEQNFSVDMPRLVVDRLMAGIQHLTSNVFWRSLPDFISMCNIFSGSPATPEDFDPADVLEMCWGIAEASLLDPQDGDDKDIFDPEIVGYIEHTLKNEGFVTPPGMLRHLVSADALYVPESFSEDPVMFSAFSKAGEGKAEDANLFVKDNLKALRRQLESLKLDTGDTQRAVAVLFGDQK